VSLAQEFMDKVGSAEGNGYGKQLPARSSRCECHGSCLIQIKFLLNFMESL
jgi:hypothetical protein